jgi:diguanylate cyclase (GGDEF)-like protein
LLTFLWSDAAIEPRAPVHRLIFRPAITATLLGLGPLVAFLVWADLSGAGAGASGRAVALWPANGIVEALLLTMPLRLWPACVAAGLLGNVAGDWLAGVPAALAVPLALCNTVEILITAGGLRHNLGEWPNPSRPLVLAEIWAFGALLAPAVSGMAAALVGLHGAPWVWFLAHGTSTAVVLPLALSLRRPAFWALLKPDRRLETGLIVGLCLVASAVAYLPLREPLSFLIFAPLLLAAVRLGIPGASLALALSAALGELTVLSRHAGQAGFAAPDGTDHVLFLQFFLAVTAATVLPLGAVTEERQRALAALRDSEARLAAANAELAALAMTDGLTGLANRRRFEDALAEEWQRAMRGATPLAVLLCDVDVFKAYNDAYGHLEGDDCLRAVAAAMRGVLRRPGDLAARIGGEEFAALLPGIEAADAVAMAERLREAVQAGGRPHPASPARVVTVSVGVACLVPPRDATPDLLIGAADQALYAAKSAGRNQMRAAPGIVLPETMVLLRRAR